MQARTWSKSVVLPSLAALVLAPWLLLASTGGQSTHRSLARPLPLADLQSPAVFSDFDGDHKLDQAELFSSSTHKSIQVSLSSSWGANLRFDSMTADRGSLLAVDIDCDHDLDLIWVSQNKLQPPVVWINDGRGKFERDGGSHASELAALLSGEADASVSQSQRVRHSLDVPPSPFPSDLALAGQPEIGKQSRPSRGIDRGRSLDMYLTYLRKRGPPSSPF